MIWDPGDDQIPPIKRPMGVKGWVGWILAALQALATALQQIL